MALHLRGNARCENGDLGGIDDLRKALEIAEDSGVAIDIVTSRSYLLEWVGLEDGPSVALPMNRETIDLSRRRGIEGQGMWTRAEGFWLLFDAGMWDELLAETDELGAWAGSHGDAQLSTVAGLYRARVLAHRGDASAAEHLEGSFLPAARQIADLQVLAPALLAGVVAHAAANDAAQVITLAKEFDATTTGGPSEYRELLLPELVRGLIAAGAVDDATRIVGERPVYVRRTRLAVASSHALLAEARGELDVAADGYRESADGWRAWGGTFERAHALAGLGRVAAGEEATEAGAAARTTFMELGVAAGR
jgi:hypothetical protein